jgi:GGDEF domain-containing protein
MDRSLLTLLLIGPDRFKLVKDRHGRTSGDRPLMAITEPLRSVVRPTDTVVRVEVMS